MGGTYNSGLFLPLMSLDSSNFNFNSFFSFQTDSDNHHLDYHQLKLQTLQFWQDQKLGNPLPSNADLYQIMRQDHPLGIDAFVSQACQLSPHVNSILFWKD